MKASIIIPVWNGRAYLQDCLEAVFAQDHPDFEVIAVDNASTDGSATFIAEHYPQVRLIHNEENLGFAGGCNVGLRAAHGETLVLLNQDTVVRHDWLINLTEALEIDPTIGIAGCKAFYPDGRIQHAGGYVNKRGEGLHYGQGQVDTGQFDRQRDVNYVTGAGLVITREAFETIGELDEGFYPAYFEDVDWCYRAAEAGFRVVYVPEAVMIHREDSSLADITTVEGMYLPQRNRLRFVFKHWSLNQFLEEFVSAERSWLEHLGEGAERLVASMHRVYLYHLLHLNDLMVWRQSALGTSLSEIETLADMLVDLRTVVPLGPARLDVSFEAEQAPTPQESGPVRLVTSLAYRDLLEDLHKHKTIEEHQFHSDVPVLGPLIAAFRHTWNSVSTRWYVRAVIRQQNTFNASVVGVLNQLAQDMRGIVNRLERHENRLNQQAYDRRRLGEVLAEYIAEHGREIGELTQELRRLNDRLEEELE